MLNIGMAEIPMVGSADLDQISNQELLRLSEHKPFLIAAHIVLEWLIILGLAVVAKSYQNLWFSLLAIFVIGTRQHSLAVLMHEGAHYHVANHRGLNDVVTELFTAWPIFVSLDSYRKSHFKHHRYVNTINDPDWRRKQNSDWSFPKTRAQMTCLWLNILLNLPAKVMMFCALLDFPAFWSSKAWSRHWFRALYYVIGIAVIVWLRLGYDVLLFWLIPFFLVFMPIAHLRSIAEHFGLENNRVDPLTQTRTTIAGWLESLIVCPNNVNYHLDHHLAPSVPFYNLPALHQLLSATSAYSKRACISKGYFAVIAECMK